MLIQHPRQQIRKRARSDHLTERDDFKRRGRAASEMLERFDIRARKTSALRVLDREHAIIFRRRSNGDRQKGMAHRILAILIQIIPEALRRERIQSHTFARSETLTNNTFFE